MKNITMLIKLRDELQKVSSIEKVAVLQRFFKTGVGEYGYGDMFIGVTVPQSRNIAQQYKNLPFPDIQTLLESKIHEERLVALLLLVHNFQKGDKATRKEIFDFYLAHTRYINNWDFVDSSAHQIVGAYLFDKPKAVLIKLAKSKNIWERRIAIIATYCFIKQNQFDETLKIAKMLLHDKHDLIQKAVGWMLREVGKKDQRVEESFLKKHYRTMPRTTLRYAIERFPENLRRAYLATHVPRR